MLTESWYEYHWMFRFFLGQKHASNLNWEKTTIRTIRGVFIILTQFTCFGTFSKLQAVKKSCVKKPDCTSTMASSREHLNWGKVHWNHIEERHAPGAPMTGSIEQGVFCSGLVIPIIVELTLSQHTHVAVMSNRKVYRRFWGSKMVGVTAIGIPCYWTRVIMTDDGWILTAYPCVR